jgi:hypothetical protein
MFSFADSQKNEVHIVLITPNCAMLRPIKSKNVMATIIQLNPILPLLTPKGKAFAHFLLDYGEEHHLMWVCFIDDTGECWTFQNHEIRAQSNPSIGRVYNKTFLGEPWKIKS